MARNRIFKLIHFGSTSWFVVCAAFLITLAMRQVGAAWWLIFSLSGYSAVLTFVLVSIYLFAVYRGVVRSRTEQEYPLTSSIYYMAFYDICPYLGALAGLMGRMPGGTVISLFSSVAIGSLAMTFLVWIIVDPAVCLVEMCLPTSRKLRHQRIAQAKAERQQRRLESGRLLVELNEQALFNYEHWQPLLEPMAEELAMLMVDDKSRMHTRETKTVELGATAWRIGGITCMRRLHEMAVANYVEHSRRKIVDYAAVWWDGIGTWQIPPFAGTLS